MASGDFVRFALLTLTLIASTSPAKGAQSEADPPEARSLIKIIRYKSSQKEGPAWINELLEFSGRSEIGVGSIQDLNTQNLSDQDRSRDWVCAQFGSSLDAGQAILTVASRKGNATFVYPKLLIVREEGFRTTEGHDAIRRFFLEARSSPSSRWFPVAVPASIAPEMIGKFRAWRLFPPGSPSNVPIAQPPESPLINGISSIQLYIVCEMTDDAPYLEPIQHHAKALGLPSTLVPAWRAEYGDDCPLWLTKLFAEQLRQHQFVLTVCGNRGTERVRYGYLFHYTHTNAGRLDEYLQKAMTADASEWIDASKLERPPNKIGNSGLWNCKQYSLGGIGDYYAETYREYGVLGVLALAVVNVIAVVFMIVVAIIGVLALFSGFGAVDKALIGLFLGAILRRGK